MTLFGRWRQYHSVVAEMKPTIFINTVLLQVVCERTYTIREEEDFPMQLM